MIQEEFNTYVSKNGMRIIHKKDNSLITMIGIAIGVGSRDETIHEHGVAHCIEHMLFKGTRKRNSTQIINRIESIGGELNAYTSKEETIVYASVPKEFSFRAIDILFDIVTNSKFPEEELKKEKTVILDEINIYKDSPSELIYDEYENMLFKSSSIGHYILGTEKSVKNINYKKLNNFYKKYYYTENMVLFIYGDIDFDKVKDMIDYHSTTTSQNIPTKRISTDKDFIFHKVKRKGTYQSHIVLGKKAYSMYDDRKNALSLLTNILGGNSMNSRLNFILREKFGLVYNIEASYTPYTDTGIFTINLGTSKENKKNAIFLIKEELSNIIEYGLSENEIEKAKIQQKGQLKLAIDNRENIFLSMGKTFLYFDKILTTNSLFEKIDRISVEEVNAVAKEILDWDTMSSLIYL